MIVEKKLALRPILESSEGVHLTIYLVNRGDLGDLKKQLSDSLNEAYEFLYPAQSADDRRKFLEPLDALLLDAEIFESMKNNIGLFRTMNSFRVLNIPIDLERQCHVANTFHVKPLLKWMQTDRDFFLLGIDENFAHLYVGNQTSFHKVDSVSFPDIFKSKELSERFRRSRRSGFLDEMKHYEISVWLNEWLDQTTPESAPVLFWAGKKDGVEELFRNLKYKNIIKNPVAESFEEEKLSEICQGIRQILKDESQKALGRSLLEFQFAEGQNLTKRNIFQIAKAAVRGKVKKLIVADEVNVFGKIDRKTGGLAIHPFDLDHEDDDILDDLAQTVLASGGEVVLVPKDDLPKGRVALAILAHQGTGIETFNDMERK